MYLIHPLLFVITPQIGQQHKVPRDLIFVKSKSSSSSSFFLRQAFADDEALARSLQVDLSLALSVAPQMSMPCALMSSIILFIHVFVGLPVFSPVYLAM